MQKTTVYRVRVRRKTQIETRQHNIFDDGIPKENRKLFRSRKASKSIISCFSLTGKSFTIT